MSFFVPITNVPNMIEGLPSLTFSMIEKFESCLINNGFHIVSIVLSTWVAVNIIVNFKTTILFMLNEVTSFRVSDIVGV